MAPRVEANFGTGSISVKIHGEFFTGLYFQFSFSIFAKENMIRKQLASLGNVSMTLIRLRNSLGVIQPQQGFDVANVLWLYHHIK